MKILRLLASINPASGGPIEAVQQVSRIHVRDGHEVELACLDEPAAPWLAASGLPVHALGPAAGKYGYTSRLAPWLAAHHREYDAIFLEGLWQYHSFGAWRALRRSGRAYHVFPHGMLDPFFQRRYPLKHLKKSLYWLAAERRVLRDARSVLFTCEEERRRAAQSFWPYRCRERVLTLGTTRPEGDPAAARAQFFARFSALRDRRFILFLGRLHEKKGCDLLLRAFAAIAREDPGLDLVMAGPDETRWQAVLEALAHEAGLTARVTWTGMLEGALKWGAFHAAEVFALPSHQENFGIAVAEALACGVPVLLSTEVNIWREIIAAQAGFAEKDDLAGTERLLRRWLALPPADRLAMRVRAASCFEEKFEARRAAQLQLEIAAG